MKFCQMSNKPLNIGPDILQISVVAKFCRIWSHWLWHNHYTPSPLPEFYLEIFFNSAAQKVINFFPCLLNLHFMVLFLSPSLCRPNFVSYHFAMPRCLRVTRSWTFLSVCSFMFHVSTFPFSVSLFKLRIKEDQLKSTKQFLEEQTLEREQVTIQLNHVTIVTIQLNHVTIVTIQLNYVTI